MTPIALEALSRDRLQKRLMEMDDGAQADILLEASTVAEILSLASHVPLMAPMLRLMSATAYGWLRSGLLENTLMAGTQHLYPVALLATFAAKDPAFRREDLATIGRLLAAGIVGRSELPVLTLALVAAHFQSCGLRMDTPDYSIRAARETIDKRALRARTDEYDLSTLIMVAQLAQAEAVPTLELPAVLPQTMLVQALRTDQMNWLAVLLLLNEGTFAVAEPVRLVVRRAIGAMAEQLDDLVPAPIAGAMQNDYIERVPLGLRLRSSIACCVVLSETIAT